MRVPIGCYWFDVRDVEGLSESAECYGRTWSEKLLIELDSAMPEDRRDEVLLHELIHAVSSVYALGITEEQTRTLAIGLRQAMSHIETESASERIATDI